eukprot:TRINITY_DN13641_c0_g1_i1.p1 TRINITY_DN13641_c0_g1~~TRINITY_DN13641_c0_g1_i1.p1  ORF type:complete len:159 (+),score=35.06 TRINITY_DN13641_c0_g1_i1:68-478(+)
MTLKKKTKVHANDSRVKKADAGKLVYKIDWSIPRADDLIDDEVIKRHQLYLQEHIKVNGKTGELSGKVKIDIPEDKPQIEVSCSKVLFAKRYLKFLTRKFLATEKLRDYIRAVAVNKRDYQLRYYDIDLGDDDADE